MVGSSSNVQVYEQYGIPHVYMDDELESKTPLAHEIGDKMGTIIRMIMGTKIGTVMGTITGTKLGKVMWRNDLYFQLILQFFHILDD